jgi:hypothetical protein
MPKKKIWVTASFIVLIIPALLVMTGCPQHIDSLYGLKVVSGGGGAAIAVYEDKLGGNIYAQKVGPEGKKMWGVKGVLLGPGNSKAYSFFNFNIVSDGSGGAIIAWPDSTQDQFRPTSHLARIEAEGKLAWQRDFIYFNQIISDGSGGTIIAFNYSAGEHIVGEEQKSLTLVRVDALGDYPWGLQGVTIPRGKYQDNTLQMTLNGSGEVILVWEELQSPPEAKPGETISTGRIFAQKLNNEGKPAWGDGILIYTTPENTYTESPQIISTDSGGALVAWQQMFNGRIEGGSTEAGMMDIFVQKLDSGGNLLWQANGLPLEIDKNAGNAFPTQPLTVSDGSGGGIIIWRDSRDKTCIYAQRIDAGGTVSWKAGGVKVSSASLNPNPQIVSSGPGEAIISYSFQEDGKSLHTQKLDITGQVLWQENGVPITDDGFSGYSISPDGQGGLILGWGTGKGTFNPEKVYLQRVSPDGELLWGKEGIRINP